MATTIYGGRWKTSRRVFAGGLVADCGKYLADWPPPYPMIAQNLPEDATRLDYIIALPNPSETADHVIDGSYPTVFFHMWMRRSGSDIVIGDFGIQQSGGASGTDLPHGAHLYVGFYSTSREKPIPHPSLPADDVVPQDWTITARGWAREKSFWSKWQRPADDAIHEVSPDFGTVASAGADFYTGVTGGPVPMPGDPSTDLAAVLAGFRDEALAQDPYQDRRDGMAVSPGGAGYGVTAEKVGNNIPAGAIWASYQYADELVNVEAPKTIQPVYVHSILDALVEGEDYAPNPITGETIEYERPAQFLGWEDMSVDFEFAHGLPAKYGGANQISYCENIRAPHARWAAIDGELESSTAGPTEVEYGMGTELAHWDGAAPDPGYPPYYVAGAPGFAWDWPGRSGVDTITLPLSRISQRRWTLLTQLDYRTYPEPFYDFTVGDAADYDDTGPEGRWHQEAKTFGFQLYTHFGRWHEHVPGGDEVHQGTVNALYRMPHWRYWKLGKLIARIGYIADSSPKNRDVVWV